MAGFRSLAYQVRDARNDRALRRHSLRRCLERFAPYGHRATWWHLCDRHGIGPEDRAADPSRLVAALEELEDARAVWLEYERQFAERRRREKHHGLRRPEWAWSGSGDAVVRCADPGVRPSGTLGEVLRRLVAALESEPGRVCPVCGARDLHWPTAAPSPTATAGAVTEPGSTAGPGAAAGAAAEPGSTAGPTATTGSTARLGAAAGSAATAGATAGPGTTAGAAGTAGSTATPGATAGPAAADGAAGTAGPTAAAGPDAEPGGAAGVGPEPVAGSVVTAGPGLVTGTAAVAVGVPSARRAGVTPARASVGAPTVATRSTTGTPAGTAWAWDGPVCAGCGIVVPRPALADPALSAADLAGAA